MIIHNKYTILITLTIMHLNITTCVYFISWSQRTILTNQLQGIVDLSGMSHWYYVRPPLK